jgi:hypothetical protein
MTKVVVVCMEDLCMKMSSLNSVYTNLVIAEQSGNVCVKLVVYRYTFGFNIVV